MVELAVLVLAVAAFVGLVLWIGWLFNMEDERESAELSSPASRAPGRRGPASGRGAGWAGDAHASPDDGLYRRLDVWRRRAAKDRGVNTAAVLDRNTMAHVVEARPRTKRQLRKVKGIGRKRIEHHGDEILAIVAGQEPPPTRPPCEGDEVRRWLEKNGVRALYHFTDEANLPSIKRHGLYSWVSCRKRGIRIACPGGDKKSGKLDKEKGLQDYVRLSFYEDHPMLHAAKKDGRIRRPVVLEVSVEVACLEGTLFSDVNATAKGARVGRGVEHLQNVRLDVIRRVAQGGRWESEEEKGYVQAEILVRSHVPTQYISFRR